ncbi:TPT-domain-containing protein [Fomitiporia mediterranea MF3/22]|uniref:TPT-domain-containing protein n=1 Tax=Fomitiporia mediterranea (strain MF3/22) TaxID=694068 RepID=UPI000440807A|nr:TPT-domain-containing protein [Fomitiporia mediterranea MF3/22]EJD02727.1 TPT-domain-containing protein [Fomitiporia mediterranea MF3/22]
MPSRSDYNALQTDPDLQPPAYNEGGVDEEDYVQSLPPTKEERKRLWWRNAIINSLFIAAWFIVAILLSVYNKWMFSPDHYGFTWPLFVTMLHMFVQFGFAAAVRNVWPSQFRPPHNPGRKDYLQKAVPTGVATGFDIGLSNLSLKLITLSFYTMCKSSSLIFVLFFAFIFKLEKFSFRLVGVILLIFVGVLMMVATDTQFEVLGFVLITTASALSGLRWSLTHLLLKSKKMGMNNPAATIFWLAPIMGASLAIVSLALEDWAAIIRSKFFDSVAHILSTVLFLAIPGTMAFAMVLSEYYIIQRAGVVPMSIAGIAKEVSQISVSAWLFGDELTPLNVAGVAVTVCGIGLFTYHKYHKSVDTEISKDDARRNHNTFNDMEPSLELEERGLLSTSQLSGSSHELHFTVSNKFLVHRLSSWMWRILGKKRALTQMGTWLPVGQ